MFLLVHQKWDVSALLKRSKVFPPRIIYLWRTSCSQAGLSSLGAECASAYFIPHTLKVLGVVHQ